MEGLLGRPRSLTIAAAGKAVPRSEPFGMDEGEDEIAAEQDGDHEGETGLCHGRASEPVAGMRIGRQQREAAEADGEKDEIEHGGFLCSRSAPCRRRA
jgi:hypothetical protein